MAVLAIHRYRMVVKSLRPTEIPRGYPIDSGVLANAAVAILGAALTVYFFFGPQ
jgi:hypothetical protein